MAQEKVPKSLAKAATRNMKTIKQYEPSRKHRIDRIINDSKNNKKKTKSPVKKRKPQPEQIELPEKKAHFLANYADKQNDAYCSVESFERLVYQLEGIRIVLRAPTYAKVGRYPYKRRCSKDTSIRDFIENRIKRSINSTYQVYISTDKEFSLDDPISSIRKYHNPNK